MKAYQHYKGLKIRMRQKIRVSYQFNTKKQSGFGSIELTVAGNVTVPEMKKHIERINNFDNVVIVSWQPARVIQ